MDRETYEQLYLAALPGLYRVAMSILRQEADAQDALQEAAGRVWQRADRICSETARAYLMRAVINECRNIQRRRQRVTPVETLPDSAGEMQSTDLADALATMPDKLRLPLLLKYMEGCTEREAAKALGITVPAFKSRLLRARRALASALREEVDWP